MASRPQFIFPSGFRGRVTHLGFHSSFFLTGRWHVLFNPSLWLITLSLKNRRRPRTRTWQTSTEWRNNAHAYSHSESSKLIVSNPTYSLALDPTHAWVLPVASGVTDLFRTLEGEGGDAARAFQKKNAFCLAHKRSCFRHLKKPFGW